MMKHRGSLNYQVKHHFEAEAAGPSKKPGRMSAITPQTKKQYWIHVKKFSRWCKEQFHCRNFEDCALHIQNYADYLARKGLSASTIHTYLAAVCRTWGVKLEDVKKPLRHTAHNTRSRGVKDVDRRSDAKPEASKRLSDFARRVGIRRAEYARLKGDDWVQDESGCWCVRVKKGKGGKFQLQRILPQDVAFVSSYFDGNAERNIFTKGEMKNKIDLHHFRAQTAQRAYQFYLKKLKSEPAYRAKLTAEIEARWQRYNPHKRLDPHELQGTYALRGENRKLAQKYGLPVQYDRLAVMAVSVFLLSHWRNDVTVCNYLLAQ